MKTKTIVCPNCQRNFVPTNEQLEILKSSITIEFNQEIIDRKNEIQKMKLEYQRLLDEKVLQAKQEVNTQHELELLQKTKMIDELKVQLETAKKKVDSYSSQRFIGETTEVLIEDQMRELFPQDVVKEVPKGCRGADSILEIMAGGDEPTCVGRVLIEVKNARYNKNWIDKLKSDNRSISAEVLLLCVTEMPKQYSDRKFVIIDGVHVVNISSFREVICVIRHSILKIREVIITTQGKHTKQSKLFDFLTSVEFQTIYEQVLSQLDGIRASHELEKKRLLKSWAEREKMLETAITSTVELYGSLRGITTDIPQIEALEYLPKAA